VSFILDCNLSIAPITIDDPHHNLMTTHGPHMASGMEDPSAELDALGAAPHSSSQTSGSIGKTSVVETNERPVGCQLDPTRGMFRVFRSKGKALSSGGFGVFITEETVQHGSDGEAIMDEEAPDTNNEAPSSSTNTYTKKAEPRSSSEYLFVEEVLFLFERGLLQALSHVGSPLDSSELFQLLPKFGISIPIYLVYAHLRSQDFRVLRHNPKRIQILHEQRNSQRHSESGKPQKNLHQLRRRIRETVQTAPAPTIHQCTTGLQLSSIATPNKTPTIPHHAAIQICWDAYNPSSNFGKTHPGLPAFCVAATYFNVPLVRFSDLKSLLQGPCLGIPLKVATVSDSGTVIMFGVTGSGVPPICQPTSSSNKTSNDDDNDDETNREP
jgi:hypothetical protein